MKADYTTIPRYRTEEEMVKTFYNSLYLPAWLWWNLHREIIALEDADKTGTYYYRTICKTLDYLNLNDIAEVRRSITTLAEHLGVELIPAIITN